MSTPVTVEIEARQLEMLLGGVAASLRFIRNAPPDRLPPHLAARVDALDEALTAGLEALGLSRVDFEMALTSESSGIVQ